MYRPEIRERVITSLAECAAEFDVDAIVDALCASFNTQEWASLDEVDSEQYWALVSQHAVEA